MSNLLSVNGLGIEFAGADGWIRVVEDVGFTIAPGETLGLVGESGSGKTVSALAVMGLIAKANGRVTGSIRFEDRELLDLSDDAMRLVRGDEIAMIFQEPMTSLNPAFTIGNQIVRAVRAHQPVSRATAMARAVEMLDRVGIPDAHRRVDDYPHAFSGGMRQRAMIAMALACDPKLLIADEPTTALDVTVQAQILDLIRSLQAEFSTAVLFVTHDFGVVADICERVVVMYAGQLVEEAPVQQVFDRPHHPYSEGLLASMPQAARPGQRLVVIPGQVPRPGSFPEGCRFHPRCSYVVPECTKAAVPLTRRSPQIPDQSDAAARCVRQNELELKGAPDIFLVAATVLSADSEQGVATPLLTAAPPISAATSAAISAATSAAISAPLLQVRELRKAFPIVRGFLRSVQGHVRAVDGVSFDITAGETLGLVGESGSGKSTVARLVLRLIEASGGSACFEGQDVFQLGGREMQSVRRNMQIIFQDPYSSLDPRSTIADAVGEPLEIHEGLRGKARDQRSGDLLELVGMDRHMLRRYPYEFSGGQRQRIAVARALALNPRLLVCDEPVSALDVSTQSQVINLLADLQAKLGLAYLFIAHDLSVVRHISHRIAVMYLGRIVELGPAAEVANRPTHPYTEALLSAIPVPDPVRQRERKRIVLEGDIPSPTNPPTGCRFHTRCPYAMDMCAVEDPEPFTTATGTTVWCHLHSTGPALAGASVTTLPTPAPTPRPTSSRTATV